MTTFNGSLNFDARIANTDFNRTIQDMQQRLVDLSSTANQETGKIGKAFSLLGQLAGDRFASMGLSDLPAEIIRVRGEFQKLEISLGTLLQNKELAGRMMKDIMQFAAATPFGTEDTATAAKQLLMYGENAGTVMKTLEQLGDVAVGINAPLSDVAALYAQVKSQGGLDTDLLDSFNSINIPMVPELAKMFNVATQEVKGLVEAGKVGFPEVQQALNNMTAEGAIFGGLMAAEASSISGLQDQLRGAFENIFNEIGQRGEGAITALLEGSVSLLQNYEKVVDVLTVVTAAYGAYRTALALASVAEVAKAATTEAVRYQMTLAAAAGEVITVQQAKQAAVTNLLTAAQIGLNSAFLANPYVLGVTAIVAVGAAMWALNDSTTAQQKAQEDINKTVEESARRMQELRSQTASLSEVVRDGSQSQFAQLKAFSDLQKMLPDVIGKLELHEFQALSTAEAQKLMNRALEEAGQAEVQLDVSAAAKQIEELRKKLERLREQQDKGGPGAAGLTFQIAETQRLYDAAVIKANDLQNKLEERAQVEKLANATTAEKVAHYQNVINAIGKEKTELEHSLSHTKGMLVPADALKRLFSEMRLNQLNNDLKKAKDHLGNLIGGTKNKLYWTEELNNAQTALDKLDSQDKSPENQKKWKEYTQAIQNANRHLDAYNVKSRAASQSEAPKPAGSIASWNQIAQKAQKAIDETNPKTGADIIQRQQKILENAKLMAEQARLELMPYGSLQYWEQVQKIANQVISVTPGTNTTEIEAQKQIITNAQEKAEKIREQLAIRSFDEELAYKKSQYALYERWVQHMGKETADAQFAGLRKGGGTYAEYLQTQLNVVAEKGLSTGGLSDVDVNRIDKLKTALNDATGSETPFQKLQKAMAKAKESSSSLTEELQKLQELRSKIDPNDNSASAQEQRKTLSERENEVQKERNKSLQDFLATVAGTEENRLRIESHYANLRAALDEQYSDKKSAAYIKALNAINAEEKGKLQANDDEVNKKSGEYKAFVKILQKQQAELTKLDIENARKSFESLTKGLDKESEKYKEHYENLKKIEKSYYEKRIELFKTVGNIAGQLGEVMSGMGGGFAEMGKILSGFASQVGNISTALKSLKKGEDGKITMGSEGWAASLQSVIALIGMVTEASRKRRDAERQFYLDNIRFENEYSLALNEKKGEAFSDNPFMTDYDGKIRAGLDKYNDAADNYQKSLAKLEEGRAKVGQKNAIDGANVGKGAAAGLAVGLAGAKIGALVGTAVGPVGTAIGAAAGFIVGGLVGLFGGKKKKDIFGGLLDVYPELVDGAGNLNKELAQTLVNTNQVDDATKLLLQDSIAWADQIEEAKNQLRDTFVEMAGQIGDQLRDALIEAFKAGETAADAFRKTMGKVIADIVTKLIFSKMMTPQIERLANDLVEAAPKGPGAIAEALDKSGEYIIPVMEQTMMLYDVMDKWGNGKGYDLFGKGEMNKSSSVEGAIKGMSEETASLLAGQFNAIRIYNAEMAFNIRTSVMHLANIEANTSYNWYLTKLDTVIERLDRINNTSMRGFGL